MMAIGYFTEEFWEQERLDWEASQAVDRLPAEETLQVGGEPADVVIAVTIPGENDDRLGGGQAAPHLVTGNESAGQSHDPSAEPTNDRGIAKQVTIRLDGTVTAEPNFHQTSKGVPRIIFPLSVGEETHIITSTKERAESINAMTLLPGEEVHVAGVPQNFTRSVNGDLQTQQLIYAWGIRRASTDEEIRVFDSSTIRDVHP